MNEAVRAAYAEECDVFVQRWNGMIKDAGFDIRLALPSIRFRRTIGFWAGVTTDPEGRLIGAEAFERGRAAWLPSEADRAFVHSLMRPVTEPGKMAAWLAPPDRGINGRPVDYEYVRLA